MLNCWCLKFFQHLTPVLTFFFWLPAHSFSANLVFKTSNNHIRWRSPSVRTLLVKCTDLKFEICCVFKHKFERRLMISQLVEGGSLGFFVFFFCRFIIILMQHQCFHFDLSENCWMCSGCNFSWASPEQTGLEAGDFHRPTRFPHLPRPTGGWEGGPGWGEAGCLSWMGEEIKTSTETYCGRASKGAAARCRLWSQGKRGEEGGDRGGGWRGERAGEREGGENTPEHELIKRHRLAGATTYSGTMWRGIWSTPQLHGYILAVLRKEHTVLFTLFTLKPNSVCTPGRKVTQSLRLKFHSPRLGSIYLEWVVSLC